MQESDLWGWLFSQDPMPQAAANPRSFLLPALGYGRGTDVPSSDNIACAQPPGFGYGIWCTGGGASTFSADSEPHGRQPHRPGKQRETQGTHALAGARETRHCSWGLAWAGGSRKSQDSGQSEGAPGTGTSGLRQRPRSCLIQEALGGQEAVLLMLNEESGLDRFSDFFQLQFHELKFGEDSPAPRMPP